MTDLFSWTKTTNAQESNQPQAPSVDLSREQVVEQIIAINRSATAEYLKQFEQKSLNNYLDHLISSQQPRGRHARWDRPGDAPAIMSRRRVI